MKGAAYWKARAGRAEAQLKAPVVKPPAIYVLARTKNQFIAFLEKTKDCYPAGYRPKLLVEAHQLIGVNPYHLVYLVGWESGQWRNLPAAIYDRGLAGNLGSTILVDPHNL